MAFRGSLTRNLRVRKAHGVHKSARRLPCLFLACSRTFTYPSARTLHIRRAHNEDDEDEQMGSLPSPINPCSSPQPEASTSSTEPAKKCQPASPDNPAPYVFEWSQDEHSGSDNKSESDDYDEEWDSIPDNPPPILNPSPAPAFISHQDGLERYEQWDERAGWGPMSDEDFQEASDHDHDVQYPCPRSGARPRSSDRPRDSFGAPDLGIHREYHESINGEYFFQNSVHYSNRQILIRYTM